MGAIVSLSNQVNTPPRKLRLRKVAKEQRTAATIVDSVGCFRLGNIDKEAENCRLCDKKYAVGSIVTKLPCGHFFHSNCAAGSLCRSCSCPLCGYELHPKRAQRIKQINPIWLASHDDQIVQKRQKAEKSKLKLAKSSLHGIPFDNLRDLLNIDLDTYAGYERCMPQSASLWGISNYSGCSLSTSYDDSWSTSSDSNDTTTIMA